MRRALAGFWLWVTRSPKWRVTIYHANTGGRYPFEVRARSKRLLLAVIDEYLCFDEEVEKVERVR